MACKIINNSGLDISGFEDMIQSLVSFSQDRFGFQKPPALFLNSDPANAEKILGKTAYYDPEKREIHVYTTDRHPKDIMRSISHELVHHHQNCKGDFAGNHYSGQGYAQKDPHMRKMEQEAYLQGNMCFRDWEDNHKKLKEQVYNEWRTNTMSLKEWKNKELFGLLSEKWGFGKNTITEAKDDDPNRPDDFLKKQLEDAGIDTTGMSKIQIDKKAADLRLGNPEKYTALGEGKEITHMCALKVTHKESGQVGHPIQHTLTESGEISHYTVEFDEVIVENIAVENLDIMVQESHSHKRDDRKPHNEEKEIVDEEKLEMVDCGDKGRVPKYACDGEGANDLKEGEVELEEELLDEEEVDETVRAHASRNAPHFTEREQDRIRESIYNRFKKLIK